MLAIVYSLPKIEGSSAGCGSTVRAPTAVGPETVCALGGRMTVDDCG